MPPEALYARIRRLEGRIKPMIPEALPVRTMPAGWLGEALAGLLEDYERHFGDGPGYLTSYLLACGLTEEDARLLLGLLVEGGAAAVNAALNG